MVTAYRPLDLNEALSLLSEEECIPMAGGTDLMVKNKPWSGTIPNFQRPVVLISDLKELRNIQISDEFLKIGAACTCSQIIEDRLVPDYIRNIFSGMSSPAVRNIATIGGNICNSSPAGDSLPLLYALDTLATLKSFKGVRNIPVSEFITGPGKNIIRKDELMTEIKIPLKNYNVKSYKKVGTRKSTALAKLSFVGLAAINNKKIDDMRIAFGAVGPTVVRDKGIETEIINIYSDTGKIDINAIKGMYNKIINPIDDQRSTAVYRREVCLRLLEDFLKNKLMNL